jgi:hypothetical protein
MTTAASALTLAATSVASAGGLVAVILKFRARGVAALKRLTEKGARRT